MGVARPMLLNFELLTMLPMPTEKRMLNCLPLLIPNLAHDSGFLWFYVKFSTHLAMTKHFNARARVWVQGCIMHEAKLSALCNREPIRVHHALKCVVMAKCVLNVLVLVT